VFGDEPVYDEPEQLRRDVSAARAAAVQDIAIFCLEGILQKADPGAWVDAITEARAEIPESTWRAKSVVVGAEMTTRLLDGLDRLSGSGFRRDPAGS
jgi:hypothetical protein